MSDRNESAEAAEQEQPTPKKRIQILKREVEPSDWVRISVLLVVLGLLVWGAVEYMRYFGRFNTGDLMESGLLLKQFITVDYPRSGLLIMMFLEMIHVVLSFIPAGLIAFASGMIYGAGWGMVINIVGTAVGTAISFYLSRLLGRKVVTLFVKDKDMQKVGDMLSGDVSMLVLIVLFILPTPKDFFSYFMGLTNIKAWKYFTISALGRLPGMFVTTYMGAHILDRNYVLLACSVAFMAVVMILLVLFKNKILAMLKRKES